MFYYTYVLQSSIDHDLYIGSTSDPRKRLDKHNKGRVESTAGRVPLKLAYYEACLGKGLAFAREKQLKTGFGRKYLKERLGLISPTISPQSRRTKMGG